MRQYLILQIVLLVSINVFSHIHPAENADNVVYQNKNSYRLPFEGRWYVTSGGRTREENQNHYSDYATRFAIDFVCIEDTVRKKGFKAANLEYKSFGKNIMAPADGFIEAIENNIPDNKPGELNLQEVNGNYVIINHGNGEYSIMAHLKRGSVTVKTGQNVKAGQIMGRCGNSGNSTGPQLHFSLISQPDPIKTMSLPTSFSGFHKNGILTEEGEVRKGDIVYN